MKVMYQATYTSCAHSNWLTKPICIHLVTCCCTEMTQKSHLCKQIITLLKTNANYKEEQKIYDGIDVIDEEGLEGHELEKLIHACHCSNHPLCHHVCKIRYCNLQNKIF